MQGADRLPHPVKPNLCSGLPVDLFNFKADHPEFPQQRTADQFFDEAQWESYFQLGNALGERFDRDAIERMLANVGELFVRDDGSPVGGNGRSRPRTTATVVVPVPPARMPSRLATRDDGGRPRRRVGADRGALAGDRDGEERTRSAG